MLLDLLSAKGKSAPPTPPVITAAKAGGELAIKEALIKLWGLDPW
jgi:hypothetical protein